MNGAGLSVWCDWCHDPMTQPGGLLFGPPDVTNRCVKRHICRRCYDAHFAVSSREGDGA